MNLPNIKQHFTFPGKLLPVLVLLLFFIPKAKADTIDFCSVYLNDSLILKMNENDFATAQIHLSRFHPGDSIRIEYWTDTGERGGVYVARDKNDRLVRQTGFVPYGQTVFSVAELPKDGCRILMIRGSSRPETHLFDIVFD